MTPLLPTPSLPSYYHRNRQYNTVALTDAVGAIVEQYSTDAMGRVKAFDAAAAAKPAPTATTVLFTGRVFDAETDLYYFRARYFEPELGVFVSRDPLGFVDGESVYQGWFVLFLQDDAIGTAFGDRPAAQAAQKLPPLPQGYTYVWVETLTIDIVKVDCIFFVRTIETWSQETLRFAVVDNNTGLPANPPPPGFLPQYTITNVSPHKKVREFACCIYSGTRFKMSGRQTIPGSGSDVDLGTLTGGVYDPRTGQIIWPENQSPTF